MRKTFTLRPFNARCLCSLLPGLFLILLLTAGTGSTANAQPPAKTISGRVVDKKGDPVIGASVVIAGTTTGVLTGADGSFTLTASDDDTLLVSFLGLRPQEMPVSGRTDFRIVMEEDSIAVEEVVKMAYGTQRKVSVVGAVAAVGRGEIMQSSAPNLSAALAGRLPGLTTLQTNGQPGNDAVLMYVRGISTFGGGTSPLILIDGIPRDNISSLDPSEIESISILKDASATAVFGVRGANGVILITTRRGKAGEMNVDVLFKHSLQQPLYHRDRVHSWEFANLRNEALRNDGKLPEFSDSDILRYKEGGDPFYPDRDIYKEVFKDFAPQTQVNVNLSGGTEALQYFVSAGFLNQKSIFRQDKGTAGRGYDPSFKLNRYNLRLNIDYQLAKGLKANLDFGGDISESNSPLAGGHGGIDYYNIAARVLDFVRKTRPVDVGPVTVPGYKNNLGEDAEVGYPVYVPGGYNIWETLNRDGYSTITTSNYNTTVGLDWDLGFITKGLSTKGLLAFDVHGVSTLVGRSSLDHRYIVDDPADHTYRWAEPLDGGSGYANVVRLSRNYASEYRINMQYQVNYNRTFSEVHNVTGMFLAQRDTWMYGASGEHALPFNMIGIAGRVTYGYDNRYLAEVNIGYNGSEQFMSGKRFGFFPAVSAGWVVSNEKFMGDFDLFNMLKVRGSYGKVGNDKLGSDLRTNPRFLYLDNIAMTNDGIFDALGYGAGVMFNLVGNPNLSWEKEDKRNVGFDVELKQGLYLNFDYYNNYRSGILATRSDIPSFQGVTQLPLLNIGEMKNWGYEVVLGYRKVFNNDLSVNVAANFAFNDNRVVYISEQSLGDDYVHPYRSEGHRYGQIWGYRIDYGNGNGYINTDEELARYKPMYESGTVGTPTKGDFIYKDLNGDGRISEADQMPIGWGAIPRINYSATASVRYRAFDISVQFQGIAQASLEQHGFLSEAMDGFAGYYNGVHRQSWSEERYLNGEPIRHPALHTSPYNASRQNNDYFVQDRSFLRLKMAEIGFTLPSRWTGGIGVKSARVAVNGQNLITWDKLRTTDIDPEQQTTASYPLSRIITFNLNINF